PLLTTGVSVDLPRASATALNVERKPIAVSLNEQGQLYVMDEPIADADLVAKLQAASQSDVDQRIYLRASKAVPYGRVAEIMAAVTTAGYKKVASSPSRSNNSRERHWTNGGHIRVSPAPPRCMARCWR